MSKHVFTTSWLADRLHDCSKHCKYVYLLNIPNEEKSTFVVDLLHSALQEIFLSQEHLKEYEYESIFSRYISPQAMFDAGRKEFRFEHIVNQIPYYCEIAQYEKHREVLSLPSTYEMTGTMFDIFYCEFVEAIREFLGGEDINPYLIVRLISVNPSESFVIDLKGDIRAKVFAEMFPDGRYNPNR